MSAKFFMVIFDDEQGVCCPYGFDPDCKGALQGASGMEPVALFTTRAEARTAIKISTAYAKLRQAQGEPVNEDFITCLKSIKIVPAKTSQQKHHEN